MDATLEIEPGVVLDVIYEFYEDDAQTIRTDFTGWKVILQARRQRGDSAALLDLSTADLTGELVLEAATSGPSGKWLHLKLNAVQTAAFTGPGVYGIARVSLSDATQVQPLVVEGPLALTERLIIT